MMLCCVLLSIAMLPVVGPVLARLRGLAGWRGVRAGADCCAAPASAVSVSRRLSVAWLIAGTGILLVAGYVVLSAPVMAAESGSAPMSEAELWFEALHDAWCLPARG